MSQIESLPGHSIDQITGLPPVAPGGSDGMNRVIQAALNLQLEINQVDCVLLSPDDEIFRMPNRPQYGAGDVSLVATTLPHIQSVMYEVELMPEGRPAYSFILTLRAAADGIRLQQISGVKIFDKSDDFAEPKFIKGPNKYSFMEIILGRLTGQLREKRQADEQQKD